MCKREDKVFKSNSSFYQAYIYLNRDDMESMVKAEKMYEELYKDQKTASACVNQYVACIRICTCMQCSQAMKERYFTKAERVEEVLENQCTLDLEQMKIVYANRFYLYMRRGDTAETYRTYIMLPDELKYEYACAQYIVRMFAENGEPEKAQEYLEQLSKRYGETKELMELRAEVAGKVSNAATLKRPADLVNEENNIEILHNALLQIRKLQGASIAKVRLGNSVVGECMIEAHLLYMVLYAALALEQYGNLFKYNGHIAGEDTYNKWFQVLFNGRNKEIYDYYVMDQSQEGTTQGTLDNGYEGIGRLDNAVYHGDRMIGIVEGLILRSADRASIELHTRKIEGYNSRHVSTAFVLIYADNDNPLELWNKYISYLKEISYDNSWEMVELVEKEKLVENVLDADILRNDCKFICMTKHKCRTSKDEIHKYHILLDFNKYADVQEAKDARKVKKR